MCSRRIFPRRGFWGLEGPVQGGQSQYGGCRWPRDARARPAQPVRRGNPRQVLRLTDNLPTGYHAVVGQASGKGMRRGVIGDGAVGFLATHTAGLFGPAAVILLGHHDERGRLLGITVAVVGRDLSAAVVIRGRSRPVPSAGAHSRDPSARGASIRGGDQSRTPVVEAVCVAGEPASQSTLVLSAGRCGS